MTNTKLKTEKTLAAFKKLEDFSLKLNLEKTQIMTDRLIFKDETEIAGVQLTKYIKYLRMKIFCDR